MRAARTRRSSALLATIAAPALLLQLTACPARSKPTPSASPRMPAPAPALDAPDAEPTAPERPSLLTEQKLWMRWSSSWNRHWAGARGADHANHAGTVSLTISATGVCDVSDEGTKVDSVLDGEWHEQTTTTWSSSWQGACTLDDDKLQVELARQGAGTCSKTVARRRGTQHFAPATEECVLAERLKLECETSVVESAKSNDDFSGQLERVPVWSCQLDEASEHSVVGSPFGWIFGKDRCLERLGGGPGSGRLRYAACQN
jgi:hypothetical protein